MHLVLARFFSILFLALSVMQLSSQSAQAGIIELGLSGNYSRRNIDTDAYDETTSLTGSVSYYFSEMSAVELSYTDGSSLRYIGMSNGLGHKTTVFYRLIGLDFVLTIGGKDAIIRPYVKVGGAFILQKRLVDQYQGNAATIKEDPQALVPSAGAGFKFSLTQNLSLKAGVEAWTSRAFSEEPRQFDYAARMGVSLMF